MQRVEQINDIIMPFWVPKVALWLDISVLEYLASLIECRMKNSTRPCYSIHENGVKTDSREFAILIANYWLFEKSEHSSDFYFRSFHFTMEFLFISQEFILKLVWSTSM